MATERRQLCYFYIRSGNRRFGTTQFGHKQSCRWRRIGAQPQWEKEADQWQRLQGCIPHLRRSWDSFWPRQKEVCETSSQVWGGDSALIPIWWVKGLVYRDSTQKAWLLALDNKATAATTPVTVKRGPHGKHHSGLDRADFTRSISKMDSIFHILSKLKFSWPFRIFETYCCEHPIFSARTTCVICSSSILDNIRIAMYCE